MRRMALVFLATLFMAIGGMVSNAQASTLVGHPFYVYHSITADFSAVFMFDSTGGFCGMGTFMGITSSVNKQIGTDVAFELINEQPPDTPTHFAVYYTDAPNGYCPGTESPLPEIESYYIAIW